MVGFLGRWRSASLSASPGNSLSLEGAIYEELGAEEILQRPILLTLAVALDTTSVCDYLIQGELSRDDEGHLLTLKAQILENPFALICLPVVAPSIADGTWSLGALQGDYQLRIYISFSEDLLPLLPVPIEISSTYRLQVDHERVLLSYEDGQAISFETEALRRIPQGLIWAHLQTEEEPLRHGFLQDLRARGAVEERLHAGVYSWDVTVAGFLTPFPGLELDLLELVGFTVDDQGVASRGQEHLWTLAYAGDTEVLEELVSIWEELFCDRIAIDLWTWKGEHFGFSGCQEPE
jgi:hypothetical protein